MGCGSSTAKPAPHLAHAQAVALQPQATTQQQQQHHHQPSHQLQQPQPQQQPLPTPPRPLTPVQQQFQALQQYQQIQQQPQQQSQQQQSQQQQQQLPQHQPNHPSSPQHAPQQHQPQQPQLSSLDPRMQPTRPAIAVQIPAHQDTTIRPQNRLQPLVNPPSSPQRPVSPSPSPAHAQPSSSPRSTYPCDNDNSHIAVIHCDDCDEKFCVDCDATLHSRPKTMTHKRIPLSQALMRKSSPTPRSETKEGGTASPRFAHRNFDRSNSMRKGASVTSSGSSSNLNVGERKSEVKRKSMSIDVGAGDVSKRGSGKLDAKEISAAVAASNSKPLTPRGITKDRTKSFKQVEAEHGADGRGAGNILNQVPIEQLRSLGMSQLNEIWAQYDIDGNGVLDRRELKLLANDCIARTLKMFEDQIKKQNPRISQSALNKALEKERFFLLPGKSKEDSHKEMVKMLVRKLDVNRDGNVTKSELLLQWNTFSKDLFQLRNDGALDCSIM